MKPLHYKIEPLLLCCLVIMLSLSAPAQNIIKSDLKKCVEMALQNDQRVRIASLEMQRMKYQKREALGNGLPQISANGTLQNYLQLPTQLIPGEFFGLPAGEMVPVQFGTNYNASAGISGSWLLYNQTFLTSMKMAGSMIERGQLDIEKNSEDVAYDVAQLYFFALQTRKQAEFAQDNLHRLDSLATLTQILLEKGLIRKTDLDRILVNKVNVQTEMNAYRMAYRQQLNLLRFFTGINTSDSLELPGNAETQPLMLPASVNADGHIDLRILNKQKELAGLQKKMVWAEFYPGLSAFGNYTTISQQNKFNRIFNNRKDWMESAYVGLSLDIPIFGGFRKYNRLRQSDIQILELGISREQSKKFVETGILNARQKLESSRGMVTAQQSNVKLAEDVYAVVFDQYKQGIAALTDLLNAGFSLTQAQSGYTQALVQMRLAEVEILKSSGTILTLLNQ